MVRFRRRVPWLAAALVGAALLVVPTTAHASIQLQLYEDGNLIHDFGPQGGTSFGITAGTYGDFTVGQYGTISATSNSPGGQFAELQLANVFISTTGSHTLQIVASGDGFQSPASPPLVFITSTASISGIAGSTSSTFTSSVGTGLLDTSIQSAPTITLSGSGSYSASDTRTSDLFNVTPPYALTIVDVLSFGSGGGSVTVNGGSGTVTATPEPATLTMAVVGLPLLGIGRLLRKRKKKAQA